MRSLACAFALHGQALDDADGAALLPTLRKLAVVCRLMGAYDEAAAVQQRELRLTERLRGPGACFVACCVCCVCVCV